MDNILEIHDGNFHLTIHLDKLITLPVAHYRRLLRLLWQYPEAMVQLGEFLCEQIALSKVEWAARSREFRQGWRIVDARSRAPEHKAKLSENKRLEKNLRAAKCLYERYNRLLQIYEKQGGTHT